MDKAGLVIFVLLFLLASCTGTPQVTVTPVPSVESAGLPSPTAYQNLAALVNGQPIYRETLEKQVAQFKKAFVAQGVDLESEEGKKTIAQVRRQVMEGLIDQVIIQQAASRMGITVSAEEVEKHIQELAQQGNGQESFEEWLKANDLTLAELREMIRVQLLTERLFEAVVPPPPEAVEQVHARHILLDSEEEARQVLQRLKQGEDFASLAKQFSRDEFTRENGGDLGFFPKGLSGLPPEVEEAAFSLEPGQFSDVVKSYFGYHIVQVVEKDPARPLSDDMKRAFREQEFRKWLEQEKAKADIQRFVQ